MNWETIDTVPIDTPVLIYAAMHLSDQKIICAATFDGEYWHCHGADGYEMENTFDSDSITHWMPLPEAPTGIEVTE